MENQASDSRLCVPDLFLQTSNLFRISLCLSRNFGFMDIETQFYDEEGERATQAFESTASNQNVDTNNSISTNKSPKKSTLVGLNQSSGSTNVETSAVEEHAPTQEFVEESEAESDELYEDDFEVNEEVSQDVESQFSVSDDPEGIFSTQKKSGSQEILSPGYQSSKRSGDFLPMKTRKPKM